MIINLLAVVTPPYNYQYRFTVSWKVLNWFFMVHCSRNVSSTDPTDGTSPVQIMRYIFSSWLFLLVPLWVLLLFFFLSGFSGIGIWITLGWALVSGVHGIPKWQPFQDFRFIFCSYFPLVAFNFNFFTRSSIVEGPISEIIGFEVKHSIPVLLRALN